VLARVRVLAFVSSSSTRHGLDPVYGMLDGRQLRQVTRRTGVGLFVPKPSRRADCQRCSVPELGITVRQRPLASVAGDGDCYSVGYSVRRACFDRLVA